MLTSSFGQHLERITSTLDNEQKTAFNEKIRRYVKHFDSISINIYDKLIRSEQERLITWFMKRWLSIDTVSKIEKLEYQSKVKEITSQKAKKITIKNKEYHTLDLERANLNGRLTTYTWNYCIHDYYYRQYHHEKVKIRENSMIIDAGAFVGDTALLFSQTYKNPTIHSFELLDENIELLKINIEDNNVENVKIYKIALSDKNNDTVYIKAQTIQGATSIFGAESDEAIKTITIDQHIKNENLSRIDLIKMDIEGAERYALAGAKKTINKYKPTLAICIYHLWDDIIKIPEMINEINPSYNFSFNWVELNNGWEAVLFAFEGKK